jgi:hypothetical protein
MTSTLPSASKRAAFLAADVVKHTPSGETWVLACDEDNDRVMPCGWPCTVALASDCDLVSRPDAEERRAMLGEVAVMGSADSRKSLAIKQLAALGTAP